MLDDKTNKDKKTGASIESKEVQEVIPEITKVCCRCGEELPLSKFRMEIRPNGKKAYRSKCKHCTWLDSKARTLQKKTVTDTFDPDTKILLKRQYKQIKPERILDLTQTGLDVKLIGEDEIFVKLPDCKDTWFSCYGRMIRKSYGKYNLLNGITNKKSKDSGLVYSFSKNVFKNGKWQFQKVYIGAERLIVETFIENPDCVNNTYIWHRGNDKSNYYYKDLYPLTREQNAQVRDHYRRTGEDSEEYIVQVMNDIRYKNKNWSAKRYEPTVCGVGYWGCNDVDRDSTAYSKWRDMLHRCYNPKIHEKYPGYIGCTVSEEWKNFSNFKYWYEKNNYGSSALNLDKDILYKGNKIYSPDTCCIVPKDINTLFTNCRESRGALPIGVYKEEENGSIRYKACVSVNGDRVKLGTFKTPEKAFQKYKEYKEQYIKKLAEKYKDKIPYSVYEAMMNWEVEITD